jgi:tetratricopeptide (TPR) repeat protein
VALELAEVRRQLRAADALDSYVAAIARFVARADHAGEAEARVAYGVALYGAGRPQAAWGEVVLIHEAAKRGGDAQVIARGLVYEAWLAHQTGERLGRAMRALHEAETLVFPNGRYANQVRVLLGLGNVSLEFGRYDVALSYYERAMSLARERDDLPMVAFAGSNLLTTRRKQMEQRPDLTRLPAFTDEARRLVATADTTRNPLLQAVAHLALGDLLASAGATRGQASTHYDLALGHARRSGDRNQLATSLWALGRFLADERPVESQRLIDEALQMAVRSGSATSIAYAWRQQMRLVWKNLPRDAAIAESLRALDAIETLRTLQGGGLERASIAGAWTTDYHWLTGRLLGPAPRSRDSVSLAFSVSERMRARALLDALQRPRAQDRASPSQVRRVELLQAISAVQSRLLDPAVRGVERQHAVRELERLEREEAHLRAGDGAADAAAVTASELASLDTIERSLRANEALLSFIVGVGPNFYGESEGGAWFACNRVAGSHPARTDALRLSRTSRTIGLSGR